MTTLVQNEEPEGDNLYEFKGVLSVKLSDGEIVITFEDIRPTVIFKQEFVKQLLVQ